MIEMTGIPVDAETLEKIKEAWPSIKEELMIEANKIYPFYEKGSFKLKAFEEYLKKNKIPWEHAPSGRPNTSSIISKEWRSQDLKSQN